MQSYYIPLARSLKSYWYARNRMVAAASTSLSNKITTISTNLQLPSIFDLLLTYLVGIGRTSRGRHSCPPCPCLLGVRYPLSVSTADQSPLTRHRAIVFVLFQFSSFRSIRTVAGPGGVIGSLPRLKQRWANHR